MSKILVACAIVDFGERLASAVEAVRAKVQGKFDVVSAEQVPWQQIRAAEGGSWERAYGWAVSNFDGVILLETQARGLGRGTYEIARGFLDAGKSVGVVRNGVVVKVRDVVPIMDRDPDWKQRFATVVIGERF
jgi:hypothetical protein